MSEISDAIGGGTVSSIAVLAALNIASSFFDLRESRESDDDENEKLRVEAEHSSQKLERLKSEFQDYKQEVSEKLSRVIDLQVKVKELVEENEELVQEGLKAEKRISELMAHSNNLNERLRTQDDDDDDPLADPGQLEELEERLKEVEDNCFELQMENIRLKRELGRHSCEED
jgi:chromosome segregation ATPase